MECTLHTIESTKTQSIQNGIWWCHDIDRRQPLISNRPRRSTHAMKLNFDWMGCWLEHSVQTRRELNGRLEKSCIHERLFTENVILIKETASFYKWELRKGIWRMFRIHEKPQVEESSERKRRFDGNRTFTRLARRGINSSWRTQWRMGKWRTLRFHEKEIVILVEGELISRIEV